MYRSLYSVEETQPSVATLVSMKDQIATAQKGLRVLKQTCSIIDEQLRSQTALQNQNCKNVQRVSREALVALCMINFHKGDLETAMLNPPLEPEFNVRISVQRVTGVMLPEFRVECHPKNETYPMLGLGRSGEKVEKARSKFQEVITLLMEMATLKSATTALSDAITQNKKRSHALEHVILPRFMISLRDIAYAMFEKEREQFFRIKRSQTVQQRKRKIFRQIVMRKGLESSDSYHKPKPSYHRKLFEDRTDEHDFDDAYFYTEKDIDVDKIKIKSLAELEAEEISHKKSNQKV